MAMINLFMRVLLFSVLLSCCTMNTALTTTTQDRPSVRKDDCVELYYVDIHNSGDIDVADGDGHKTIHVGEMILFPPDVDYTFNESGGMVSLPLDRQFSLTWTVPDQGRLTLDIVEGCGNAHPTAAVRYLDRPLPVGTKMMLRFESTGPQDLRFDKDNDGKYSGVIKPEFVVSGKAAGDRDGPEINITTTKMPDSNLLVKISASDPSGIYDLLYRTGDEEEFKPYSGPFTVDPKTVKQIVAYSHDKLGNHSARFEPTTDELIVRISKSFLSREPLLAVLEPIFIGGDPSYSDLAKYSYDWDFGDGSPHDTGYRAIHTYKEAKSYTITLVVTDDRGRRAQASEVRQIK